MTAESTLSTFVASDGDNVVIQDWPLEPGVPLRGVVVLVHGLGEHAGRYEHVARQLNEWGFAVRGYDQCGHGESGGARGSLPTDTRLLDDLADIVDSTRARMSKQMPLIVLGHSMGGLAARAWLAAMQGDARVCHVVTIGTPHRGTWLGQFSAVPNGMQMRLNSPWLQALQAREPAERYRRFTCWYSNCDNIVFPSATAALPGATNHLVPGVAHMMLATQPQVLQSVLDALAAERW